MTQVWRGQQFLNLALSARSLVMTLASPLPLVFQRIHLLASRLAALLCVLCVLVVPSPLVNPSARSEGCALASAQPDDEDAGILLCRRCWFMGLGSRLSDWSNWRSNRICPLIGQRLFRSHSTCLCVWSQTDTATAARRCTMPCYDSSRREVHTSMSRWALVLLRHNRRFQVFRPAIPRKSSHFLELTDHESFFWWHAVQRSRILDPIFRENDVFVCHWRLANPDSMVPSLI